MQKQRGRCRTYPTKPSSLCPPPSFALKGLQGLCEGWGLWAAWNCAGPPWASSNSHISLNMWELWAQARQTALTAPALFWQLCIMKTGKVEPSAVWWCVTLCFYTSVNCLITEPMQWGCSAGFKDQTLDKFCWHFWSTHELWWWKEELLHKLMHLDFTLWF